MKIDGNQIKIGNILENQQQALASYQNSTYSAWQRRCIPSGRDERD